MIKFALFIQPTPDFKKRWELEAVREHPAEDDHRVDPDFSVDSSVDAVVCDHNVSKNRELSDKLLAKIILIYLFMVIIAIHNSETPTFPY